MARFTWDHVHLRSPNPDAAAGFYVEMFGARIVNRIEAPASLRVVLELGGRPVFIERVPPDTVGAPKPPYIGLEHIALAVDNLEEAAAAIRQKGGTFAVEPHSPKPGVTIAFVQCPDGVQVEVLHRST
jgi:catechol 2,3-dioxygenase-like lactoylglutathione lyase family enzyme